MALIPVTFKNNDTETIKTKIGKVSTITARMLYANTFSSRVGIVKGYKKDENTDELSLVGANQSPDGMWRLKFNKGAVSIFGGIGIIEQDTFTDFIVPNNVENYSFGIKVDLDKTGQQQMDFYCKPSTETLQQDDLQMNDVTGIYEFELFKITTTGATPTTSSKTTKYIYSVQDYVEDRLNSLGFKQGSVSLVSGIPTPIENNIYRQGHFVYGEIRFGYSFTINSNTKTVIGTIPKDFVPLDTIQLAGIYCSINITNNENRGQNEYSIHAQIDTYASTGESELSIYTTKGNASSATFTINNIRIILGYEAKQL